MLFVLAKLVGIFLQPSLVLLLCALAGLALRRSWLVALALGCLLAIVVLPVDEWVSRPLEDRFAAPEPPPERVDGIVTLGGALEETLSNSRGRPSLNDAAERLTETVVLSRRYPGARLVFSGGSGRIFPGTMVEADWVRTLFAQLGVPAGRVSFERESRTTAENATRAFAMAAPKPGETWLLVTSALHMPRAVATFRHAGWAVIPWPVAYKTRRFGATWGETPGARVGGFDLAMHEWIGLVAYRLLGHSASILPSAP